MAHDDEVWFCHACEDRHLGGETGICQINRSPLPAMAEEEKTMTEQEEVGLEVDGSLYALGVCLDALKAACPGPDWDAVYRGFDRARVFLDEDNEAEIRLLREKVGKMERVVQAAQLLADHNYLSIGHQIKLNDALAALKAGEGE